MKGIIKYEADDVAPIVMGVMIQLVEGFLCLLYLIALEGPYKDLKGLVSRVDRAEETWALLNLLDDELTITIGNLILSINGAILSLANVHAIDLDNLVEDERIIKFSEVLYSPAITYYDEAEELEDCHHLLWVYMDSVINIFYGLVQIILTNEMNSYPGKSNKNLFTNKELVKLQKEESSDFTFLTIRDLLPKLICCNEWMDEYLEYYKYN